MKEEFKREVLPQEHEKGEKAILNFEEVVSSILEEGRMTIEKDDTSRYPREAREMLEAVTEEDVEKAILEQADFSHAMTDYVENVNEKGRPTVLSSEKTDKSLGVSRTAYVTVKNDPLKNIQVCANVDLVHMHGQKPEIKVELYASKINRDFPRSDPKAGGDGRCLNCEGWGCWECGFTGGY